MRKPQYSLVLVVLAAVLLAAGGPFAAVSAEWRAGVVGRPALLAGLSAPALNTAQSFAILAGSTATNTGSTTITGDLGVSPGSAITGFPPGLVTGGTIHAGDAAAAQAQNDVTAAYVDLAGRACNSDLTGQDLGGLTLTSGVYCFSSSAGLTGELVLDAQGDANAVFVFQIGSALTTASNSSVRMINGGQPCNVLWQVGSSATLGTGTSFVGNILALASITLTTGARLDGRALARNGAVTMDTNVVSTVWCSAAPTTTPTSEGTTTPTSEATTAPTSEATTAPTSEATTAPTSDATTAPTGEATTAPTGEATTAPTSEATAAPTSAVTAAPTSAATAAPTSASVAVSGPTATAVPTIAGLPVTGSYYVQGEGQSAPSTPAVAASSAKP